MLSEPQQRVCLRVLCVSPRLFMSTPTIEQVMQNGALVWRVHHGVINMALNTIVSKFFNAKN